MAMYHHQLQPLDQQWDAVDMRYENCSQTGSQLFEGDSLFSSLLFSTLHYYSLLDSCVKRPARNANVYTAARHGGPIDC